MQSQTRVGTTVSEELDVFIGPHRFMKQILQECSNLLERHIESPDDFLEFLQKLTTMFNVFQAHEEIEDRYILQALMSRVSDGVRASLEKELDSLNQVNEILSLLNVATQSIGNNFWPLYGKQLKEDVFAFASNFIPHMDREEKVLLPLLMENFSINELKSLTLAVLRMHDFKVVDKSKGIWAMNILSLPPEVLLKILSYLGPVELCRLSCLHSQLYQLSFDGSLWHSLHPIQWSVGQWNFFCPWPHIQCKPINRSLEVLPGHGGPSEVFSHNGRSAGKGRLSDEKKVLDGLVNTVLPKIGQFVKVLDLSYGRSATSGMVNQVISLCPNLKYIDVSHTAITDIAFESFANVERYHLEYLNLSGCSMVTDITLRHIADACIPTILSCGVHWCVNSNQSNCDKQAFLKYLILAGCHQITDTGLRTFSSRSGLPFLKFLELSGLSRISTSGLNEFVIVCPQLQGSGLFYCDNLENGPHSLEANGCQTVCGSLCCQNLFQS